MFATMSSFAQIPTDLSGETKELVAPDGSYNITIPEEWFVWELAGNYMISPNEEILQYLTVEEISSDIMFIALQSSRTLKTILNISDDMSFDTVIDLYIESLGASSTDTELLGNRKIIVFEDGRKLASLELQDGNQLVRQTYLWTDGDNQYVGVQVFALEGAMTVYADVIDSIIQSVRFDVEKSPSQIGVKLLWDVPIESNEFGYGQLATDEQHIYVAVRGEPIQIYTYDGQDLGQIDIGEDYFSVDVAIDKDGNLWVADGRHNTLWHMTPSSEILNVIDLGDISSLGLDFIGIDTLGNIYTTVAFSEDVLIFEPDGTPLNHLYVGEEDDFVVRFEMWDDTLYANSIWNELRAYSIDGTSIDNRLVIIASAFTDRQAFVPVSDDLFIMSTIPNDDWSNVDIFLFDNQGNWLFNFDLFETVIGYRLLENILPDPSIGYLDFASLGTNRFVILNPGYPDGHLYAFEIVTLED